MEQIEKCNKAYTFSNKKLINFAEGQVRKDYINSQGYLTATGKFYDFSHRGKIIYKEIGMNDSLQDEVFTFRNNKLSSYDNNQKHINMSF